MGNFLKDKQYYIDLYDRITVDACRRLRQSTREIVKQKGIKENTKEAHMINLVYELSLYYETGNQYKAKESTVEVWMQRDRERDLKLQKAEPLSAVMCLSCGKMMDCTDKELKEEEGKDRILFWYSCSRGCARKRLFYDNTEEWRPKDHPCLKCRTSMEATSSRKGDTITTKYTCPYCKYVETEKLDLSEPKRTIDKDYEKDRLAFCLSQEKGKEYVQGIQQMESLLKSFEDIKERQNNEEKYKAIENLQKLPFGEVQKLLEEALARGFYTNLQFKAPEMIKGVTVEFVVVDNKSGREKYDSRIMLKKLIEKTLKGTNWKLMSDGVSYNLGFLSGRIKGVESEEELMKLLPN